MDMFQSIVSLLLTVFVITDISAAYLLTHTAARSNYSLTALNERAFVSVVQAISGSMLGLLGANRIIGLHFPTEVVLVVLSTAVLLQASPAVAWLWLYFRHKFEKGIED